MNPQANEMAADETKVYDGASAERVDPHAAPNTDAKRDGQPGHDGAHESAHEGGHEGPQMKLDPMPTGVVVLMVGGFVLVLGALFALGYVPRHKSNEAAEAEVSAQTDSKLAVGVTSPRAPSGMPQLELPGDAQAYQTTAIYPRTNGYLKKRYADIGDRVEKGQLLAEIDTPEVDAQLAAAQATLQQANAAASKAKDDFELAENTYQRYEGFSKTGGVTQQQLDEKRSAYTSAKATLAGADANVKADEAEVERLSALQSFQKITAPFTGTISTRGYDLGALLTSGSSGQELFTINETDVLRVFVEVPQSYATYVKVGQPIKFAVRNYPGRPFDGYIARTSGAINQATRTLRVEADVPNKDGSLYPGMYGTLQYQVQEKSKNLLIPSSTLIFGPQGMQVAVVDGENKIRFRNVTISRDLGVDVEITEGLKGNEKIVANPGQRLSEGLEVQIAHSDSENKMASPGNGQQNAGASGANGGEGKSAQTGNKTQGSAQ